MAKPIKNTPTLKGMDAVSFYEELKKNRNKKIPTTVLNTIHNDAQKLKSLLKN